MHNTEELMEHLKKDIQLEFETVNTYVDNIKALRYDDNKELVDKLILGCFSHSDKLVKEFLRHTENIIPENIEDVRNKLLREESVMADIYEDASSKINNIQTSQLLKQISKEEKECKQLVKELKLEPLM